MRFTARGLLSTIIALGLLLCSSGAGAQSPGMVSKLMRMAEIYGVGSSGKTVWAVGSHGVIFHSSDLGKTWESQDSGTRNELYSISVGENGEAWAVGRFGVVLHTQDDGKHWEMQQKETPETKVTLFKVFFVNNQEGWATGEVCSVFHTENGGKSWALQPVVESGPVKGEGTERKTAVVADSGAKTDQTAHIELSDEVFSTSGEEAQESELVSANDRFVYALHFVDVRLGWVVGEKGLIAHTEDGGKTWVMQTNPLGKKSLFGVCFKDSTAGWACGMDGTIICTNDGGNTWNASKSVPSKESLYDITLTEDGVLWAVGKKGVVLVSKDQGNTWTSNTSSPPVNQWLIDIVGRDGNLIIGGGKGTMLTSPDNGRTWN